MAVRLTISTRLCMPCAIILLIVGTGCILGNGCAMRPQESVITITREEEKEILERAIPTGTEHERAKNIMEMRGYTVAVVTDGEFIEKGGLDRAVTAHIRHADFLLCRISHPMDRITAQLITVAIVLKDGTTADILVNEFFDGV